VGHTPHLFLEQPWPPTSIPVPPASLHHLSKVLRLEPGAAVTYTDGGGRMGEGQFRDGAVTRGREDLFPPPAVAIEVAVAPPHDKDRLRFMVEKLAELEVNRIAFLKTRFGTGRLPDQSKASSWAVGALEQSRGGWLTDIAAGWVELESLDASRLWFADKGGLADPGPVPAEVTIAIGPEGGWDSAEIPAGSARLGLGRTTLRVETAAIVAATRFRFEREAGHGP
jgi:16S rRNA (uracil1498-N3)-methyltransferase